MQLEDFIIENYESFDNEEPPKKHFEHFERRLHGKTMIFRKTLLAAAVLTGLAVGLIFLMKEDEKNIGVFDCVMSAEMLETQKYYRSVLYADTEHLKDLLKNAQPDVRREIMHDINEINRDTKTFCNSADESVAAMVLYYSSKIETIEYISKMLEIN